MSGEINDTINYFINLSNINKEFLEIQKQKLFTEFCMLCRKHVDKLYFNKNGFNVCAHC